MKNGNVHISLMFTCAPVFPNRYKYISYALSNCLAAPVLHISLISLPNSFYSTKIFLLNADSLQDVAYCCSVS